MLNKITSLIFVSLLIGPTAFAQDCGCEGKPIPDLLSIVNGVKITAKDLDADTYSRITELKRQVVEARKLELDLQINSKLLETEAKKRNVSTSKLLEEEIIKKTPEPTEIDARNFFNEQKARITNSAGQPVEFTQVKDGIVAHLRSERQQELAKKFAERLRSTADLKILVDVATPPGKPDDRGRLFATLNTRQITSGDIEDSLQPVIFSVQEQMYKIRRRDLDRKINDVLLAQEAQKRQVTTRALLETEVISKVPAVTEVEAQKFYDANKDKMHGAFTDLKEQILRYLQRAETDKLQLEFAARLRKTAAIEDFLTPPESKPPISKTDGGNARN
ncbi:MAG TPA: hypothetical protein VGW58_19890 [Pyrinomonadaceae bacterium]|nr:hypothetical protein [Pyrinomonadaceae bacterium]